jgi:kinesin family protein 11
MKDMESQMRALDDFVTRARSQNAQHHDSHAQSLQNLSSTVKSSYSNIGSHFTSTYERVRDLGDEMSTKTATLQETLEPLDSVLREPLSTLSATTYRKHPIQDYQPTGETPQKVQYTYPTSLPSDGSPRNSPRRSPQTLELRHAQPKQKHHLNGPRDLQRHTIHLPPICENSPPLYQPAHLAPGDHEQRPTTSGSMGLREMDINVTVRSLHSQARPRTGYRDPELQEKRQCK